VHARRAATILGVVGGFAVSAVFTYLAVRGTDWERFRRGLASSRYPWLIPAAATLAAGVVLRAARWRLLFPPAARPPFPATLRALLVGTFFNNVLPGRAGEAIRVVTLHQDAGTSRTVALATAVTERVLDVAVLLALLFVSLPWLPRLSWVGRAALVGAAVAAVVLVAVVVLGRRRGRPLARLLQPLRLLPGVGPEDVERMATEFADGLGALHRGRIAVPALVLSVVAVLVITFSGWLVTFAFSLHVGFGAALLVMVATNLAMVIPSSPAAIGVFEAATLVALAPYGVERSQGLLYAVVLHALNSLPFIAIGALLVPRYGLLALRSGRRS
jgi:uncharacterized protein (TIRG00374 family)